MATEFRSLIVPMVLEVLREVKDPEIPVISIAEMGMIHSVSESNGTVSIEVKPTFVGCPAIGIMKQAIVQHVSQIPGVILVDVKFIYNPIWSANDISDEAREKLKSFGIATPPRNHQPGDPWDIACPYCDSPYTKLENLFGPTACRSILYCTSCKNPFECIKP